MSPNWSEIKKALLKLIKTAIYEPFSPLIFAAFLISGFIISFVFIASTVTITYIMYRDQLPDPGQLEEYVPPLVSQIYSDDGVLLAEFAGEKRIWCSVSSLKDSSEHKQFLLPVLLTVEDREFYSHWGINIWRIFGALLANIKAGRIVQGGSTITQQLSRNLFLGKEKTLARKIKEALTAIRLEHRYSKHEILELYINQIYIGKGCYGVEAAANKLFGKTAAELQPHEAALIVGVIRRPSYYLANPERAVARRNAVLSIMLSEGMIDKHQFDSLSKEPFNPQDYYAKGWKAPYFVDYVRRRLIDTYGEDWLYSEGVRVYTTLNYHLQKAAEETLRNWLKPLRRSIEILHKNDPNYCVEVYDSALGKTRLECKLIQGAIVAMDVHTGYIRVMVGGSSFDTSQFNRAVQSLRQPGSAFKPFVYLAALESGFQPTEILQDVPGVWAMADGKLWRPENYDKEYLGPITMRKALAHSRNLASIRLCERVGPANVVQWARRLGITAPLDPVLSITMGSSGVRVIDMVVAYSVFANLGVKVQPITIDRIVDRNGRVIFKSQPKKEVVLSRGTAYVMNSLLQSVITSGTGRVARNFGFLHPAGGKTGTTNEYTDAWFVGFTKDLCCAVWIGFDDLTSLGPGRTGSNAALPVWTKLMLTAYPLGPTAKDSFEVPYDEVAYVDVCQVSGLIATQRCPKVREVFLLKNPMPTQYCPLDHEKGEEEIPVPQSLDEEAPPANIDQLKQRFKKQGGL